MTVCLVLQSVEIEGGERYWLPGDGGDQIEGLLLLGVGSGGEGEGGLAGARAVGAQDVATASAGSAAGGRPARSGSVGEDVDLVAAAAGVGAQEAEEAEQTPRRQPQERGDAPAPHHRVHPALDCAAGGAERHLR